MILFALLCLEMSVCLSDGQSQNSWANILVSFLALIFVRGIEWLAVDAGLGWRGSNVFGLIVDSFSG